VAAGSNPASGSHSAVSVVLRRVRAARTRSQEELISKALLLVDVLKDFQHEDGDRLLASYRARHSGLVEALASARREDVPIVFANDRPDDDSDERAVVRGALAGRGADLVAAVAPGKGETVVLKRRYSAFDGTSLANVLREEGVTAVDLAGTATEMCVFQTAIDASRLELDVTILAAACATVDEEHERLALDYLEQVLGLRVVGRPD
jgi:nicotinamidase-related amidase